MPPLFFFLLSDSLWFSATKGICPQALTVVSNLWIVSFSSNISHPLPFSSSAISSLSFWTSLFPHLTTQFPNRQSRINFPFPSHLPSQNLIDVTTPEHETIVNLPLPSPPLSSPSLSPPSPSSSWPSSSSSIFPSSFNFCLLQDGPRTCHKQDSC